MGLCRFVPLPTTYGQLPHGAATFTGNYVPNQTLWVECEQAAFPSSYIFLFTDNRYRAFLFPLNQGNYINQVMCISCDLNKTR